MFGHNRRKRAKKKLKEQKSAFEHQKTIWEAQQPQREKEQEAANAEKKQNLIKQGEESHKKGLAEGRAYGEEAINRNYQGLTPEQRRSMQAEANNQISGDQYRAHQQMRGAQKGVGSNSGVAFAQRQHLQRQAQQFRGQAERDLNKLDSDLSSKKLGAVLGAEQGYAANKALNNENAQAEIEYGEEKRRRRAQEDKLWGKSNNIFSRV